MKIKKTNLYYIFIFSFLVISLSFFSISHAQTSNNLILSWEAQNFYPSNYEGKSLVTKGTQVIVSATGIVNNQIIDLSNADFIWYLDGNLLKNQTGAQEIIFKADKGSKDAHFIRVLVTTSNNISFTGTIDIKVQKPLNVIELPVFSRTINQNDSITLTSTPYFFNINSLSSLSFFWEINGALQEKKSRSIEINLDNEYVESGRNIIRSIINNKTNILESSQSTEQINIR